MKPLKIVFMLLIVVLVSSVGVYFVESITTPIIEDRRAQEIEEALQSIFPAIDGTTDTVTSDTDVDFGTTGITDVLVIRDGDDNVKGYVYTMTFRGFSSEIIYLVGIDAAGAITGYQTLQQNDTAGYGAQIADEENWTQFTGMSIETAGNGDFDGLAGATVTTNAWKSSFETLFNFHLDTYGYTPMTDEQLLLQKKQSLVGNDLTIESYTPDLAPGDYGITAVDVATDGTDNQAVIYTVEFVGYTTTGNNTYLIAFDLATNEVLGGTALSSDDTEGFGALILDNANWADFPGMSLEDAEDGNFDGIAGATVTTLAWKQSLVDVGMFHRIEFLGETPRTVESLSELLFPGADRFTDVTSEKPFGTMIEGVYDVFDDLGAKLGTVYHVQTIGASYAELTTIEFLIGIDTADNFTGFYMLDDSETPGRAEAFYADGYGDTIEGVAITGDYELDAVGGSTITYNVITAAIDEVVHYHQTKYILLPERIMDALAEAYPGAVSFESVYSDYDFDATINNLYAAKDGSDAVIGYVYYATATGYSGNIIEFMWGVDNSGVAQQLHIMNDTQSWDDATYAGYDGAFGTDFNTSTWLDLFEGVTFQSILDTEVIDAAGVSTTTGGMKVSLERIAQYHADQNVGGAS